MKVRPAAIVPVAEATAARYRTIAWVLAVVALVFFVATIGVRVEADAAPGIADWLVGFALWIAVFGVPPIVFASLARRARRGSLYAAAERESRWTVVGARVIAMDPYGTPIPSYSFRVTGKHRAILLAS